MSLHRTVALAVLAAASLVWAPAGGAQKVPARYRYTGWVSQVAGRQPQHMIVADGSFRLLFNDYANAAGLEPYRVCYRRVGAARRCFRRTLNGVRVSVVRRTLHRTGSYVARWYVGGRLVASWRFLIVQGD